MNPTIFLLIAATSAWKFTAYSGQGCAGNKGSAIDTKPPGKTVCVNMGGRYSYHLDKLSSDSINRINVKIYNQKGCNGVVLSNDDHAAGCYNINEGTYRSALIQAA